MSYVSTREAEQMTWEATLMGAELEVIAQYEEQLDLGIEHVEPELRQRYEELMRG